MVAAAGLLIAGLLATAPAPGNATTTAGGSFTKHTYTGPGAGPRDYWLYVPPGKPKAPRPLVVFLHGCNETAEQAAQATRFNDLAARRGFVVAYPQQVVSAPETAPVADGNGIGCWNWFLTDDQSRDASEPQTLAGLTREVAATQKVDPRRIYVEGISAGADMAVILGATYPDLYAAVGVLAGCAYRTCGDATGSLTYAAMGAHARVVPMFVENGTADSLNNVGMASGLVASWLGADDLADDGTMNGSIARTPASTTSYATGQTPSPGSGDTCVHNNSFTCPGGVVGFKDSYPYTVSTYDDANGCDVLDYWLIHGMAHAHPDAPGDGPYTDPLGPDVTAASYAFFTAHPKNGRCSR
ncbi:MAG: PHB depolymerase family esterase [Frankiales bacterium]|nr:PHB depolymerase family esterase [Frankiales bacterium]